MPPTFGNGKICYVDIPATGICRSADFYHRVFVWKVRSDEEDEASFHDGAGEVASSLDAIVAIGGQVTQFVVANALETTAKFLESGSR